MKEEKENKYKQEEQPMLALDLDNREFMAEDLEGLKRLQQELANEPSLNL